jgi:hypothetical protein
MTSIPIPEPYWEDELPSFLEMVKDELIDEAYGRKVAKSFLNDLWKFYMWVENSDGFKFEKDEKQYDGIAIDTSLRPDGLSDKTRINDMFLKLDDKSMINEEFCKPEVINDALRAKYTRDFINEVNKVQQNYIFSIKIENKNNEVAYIGGTAQKDSVGQDEVNWVIGAYKTIDEFKKCFEPYDLNRLSDELNRLSDEEILKRYFNKNGK